MTNNQKLSIALIERWSLNPGKGYFYYHNIIQESLMDLKSTSDAANFFNETLKVIKTKTADGGTTFKSYSDFMSALDELRSTWVS